MLNPTKRLLTAMKLTHKSSKTYLETHWHGDLDAFVQFYVRLEKQIKTKTGTRTEDGQIDLVALKNGFADEMKSLIQNEMHKNEANQATQLRSIEYMYETKNLQLKNGFADEMKNLIHNEMYKTETNQASHLRSIEYMYETKNLQLQNEIQALGLQLKESIQSCENRLPPPTSSPVKNGVSSLLGKMAEKTMEEHLNEIFPTGEIENYSGKSMCTDFCIKQHAKPDVLLELKNWTKKVGKGDIEKFERDCLEQQAHGVIVSLNTGFVGKENFQMKILANKYILVFLANNGYNKEVIRCAVEQIYNIHSEFMTKDADEPTLNLNNDQLAQIVCEIVNVEQELKVAKTHAQKTVEALTRMKLAWLKDRFSVIAMKK